MVWVPKGRYVVTATGGLLSGEAKGKVFDTQCWEDDSLKAFVSDELPIKEAEKLADELNAKEVYED